MTQTVATPTPEAPAPNPTLQRIAELPRDTGWLLIYLGVLGLVVPGVIGWPFLVVGGAVLVPGGPARFGRWAARKPRPLTQAGLRQMLRMMDDLDRRYPRLDRPRRPGEG